MKIKLSLHLVVQVIYFIKLLFGLLVVLIVWSVHKRVVVQHLLFQLCKIGLKNIPRIQRHLLGLRYQTIFQVELLFFHSRRPLRLLNSMLQKRYRISVVYPLLSRLENALKRRNRGALWFVEGSWLH